MNISRYRGRAADLALGGAFAALTVVQTLTTAHVAGPPRAVLVAVAGLATAVLIASRHLIPVPLLLATAVCADVVALASDRPGPVAIPVAVAVYTVAVRTGPLTTAIAAVTGWALVSAAVPLASQIGARAISAGPVVLQALVLLAAAALIGLYTAERRRVAAATTEQAQQRQREHELLAAQAVLAERVWLAGELHDAIGHHVSLLVVQAGAVRTTLPDNHPTRPILDSMIAGGREAMTEMRRLVDVLRPAQAQPSTPHTPQPGLAELSQLCQRLRDGGLPLDHQVAGDLTGIPVTVSATAYRVVQEALTNVVKHAGAVSTKVRVTRTDSTLDLRVTNAAPHTHHTRSHPTGRQPHHRTPRRRRLRRPRAGRHTRPGRTTRRGPVRRARTRRRVRAARHDRHLTHRPAGAPMSPIRVLIADDQALMRQGFRMILTAQPDIDVVAEAATGAEAIQQARTHGPDVILMDIRMPDLDGISATRQIPNARVLILTTFGNDDNVAQALRAGASGFLLKDATPEQLVHAVRVIAAGEALLDPAVTRALIRRALPALTNPSTPPRFDALTTRELEVLKLLAQGMSNAEIAGALVITEPTVKTHISRILTKLGLRDRVQAVVLAYQTGLA